jgi:hypothetical protein
MGGAIFVADGRTDVYNCTFTANTAAGGVGHQNGRGLGGAIFASDGFVGVINNTISGNTADAGRGLYLTGSFTDARAYNNIFGQADNSVSDIVIDTSPSRFGGLNNLVRNTGSPLDPGFSYGSLDPMLAPLADNGGPTQTFALLNRSPAIDSGFTELASIEGLSQDQRGPGFTRYVGAVDIGAFESGGLSPRSAVSIADASSFEGNDGTRTMTFTLTRTGDTTTAATVDVRGFDSNVGAIHGEDWLGASPGTVTFAPGATTAIVTATIFGDRTVEPDETFQIGLWRPTGIALGDALALGTIRNDDGTTTGPAVLSIDDVSTTEGHSGTKLLTFTVTRGGDASGTASVAFRTRNQNAGEGDYGPTSGTLSFAPGDTSKSISIVIKGDTKVEDDERFLVELSSASGAEIVDPSATGTIQNDDIPTALPVIRINDASTTEGNSGSKQLTFLVTLDRAFGQTVRVNFDTRNQTAGEGDYFGRSDTLTFSPGQTSKTISVTIRGDTKVEFDERFAIDLTSPVNATIGDALGIGTIRNDD